MGRDGGGLANVQSEWREGWDAWEGIDLADVGERPSFDELAEAIERSTVRARNVAARHVNADQLLAYWNNGRMIVVYEQGGRDRAEYGDKTLRKLSRRLTDRMGRGFSVTNPSTCAASTSRTKNNRRCLLN